jgi:hypothetical protein
MSFPGTLSPEKMGQFWSFGLFGGISYVNDVSNVHLSRFTRAYPLCRLCGLCGLCFTNTSLKKALVKNLFIGTKRRFSDNFPTPARFTMRAQV